MKSESAISDEFLNALVDDQLDGAERDFALDAVNRDSTLKIRTCELRGLKQMVQHAYPVPAPRELERNRRPGWSIPRLQSLAACFLLLVIGGTAGWLAHDWSLLGGQSQMLHMFQALQHNDAAANPYHYVVHVDTANPVRLKMALDEAEKLLGQYRRTGDQARVEVVANGPGLNLLRAGVSPYARRIELMARKYPNLTFLACGMTIKKLKEEGVSVDLLPHIQVTPSALEQIIKRRFQQHWVYIKI